MVNGCLAGGTNTKKNGHAAVRESDDGARLIRFGEFEMADDLILWISVVGELLHVMWNCTMLS